MLNDYIKKYSNIAYYAKDRPENTVEFFTPNDFYGHASIIKKYCGLPQTIPLPGIVPHGYGLNHDRIPWKLELQCALKNFYLWGEEKKKYYENYTDKPIFIIGSPFSYGVKNMEEHVSNLKRNAEGTVVFPQHSTHHVDVTYKIEEFIQYLKRLPRHMHPINICLYWKDVLNGTAEVFRSKGLTCITAGHIYDPQFIERIIEIISSHKSCVFNKFGTSALYAAAMGLKLYFFQQEISESGEEKFLAKGKGVNVRSAVNILNYIQTEEQQFTLAIKDQAQSVLGFKHIMDRKLLLNKILGDLKILLKD